MTFRRQRVLAFVAFLAVFGASRIASADFMWDFWTGAANTNGWTAVNGSAFFRAGDNGGVTPFGPGTGEAGFAHDGPHTSFIYRSPVISFASGSSNYGGGLQVEWAGGGRYGDGISSAPAYANPAAVLAFNGGNSADGGQRGLAFLNITTGNYDAILYKTGNGGALVENYTLPQLQLAGVNPLANYRLDYFETDQGGWGWGQLNFINLAAGAQVPEPTSIAIWGLIGLGLAVFGYRRIRR